MPAAASSARDPSDSQWRAFIRSMHQELLGRDIDTVALDRLIADVASLTAEEAYYRIVRSEEYQARKNPVPLLVPPGHFYSPITDPRELGRRKEDLFDRGRSPSGIDLREAEQVRYLERMAALYGSLDFPVQPRPGARFYYENPAFSYGDAITLACTILLHRPSNVIEVGSGFSSAVTLETISRNPGLGTRCLFVEPYPDTLEERLLPEDRSKVEILRNFVQDVDLAIYDQLERNDILFIDSTHVVKTGSDVVHHVTRVLPRLKPGVLIHFHDIFYPFEYPALWALDENRSWNEIYYLHAFLSHNSNYEIVFFNDFMGQQRNGLLRRMLPLFMHNPGGSLWLRKLRAG